MPRFPHRPLLRPAALTAALLAFAAAPAAAAAGSSPAAPAGPGPAAGSVPAVTTASTTAISLTLLNGDRALVADAGPHTLAIQQAPGSALASAVMTVRLAGHSLLIPVAALPYLGRGLDTSLFDVSSLRRAEQGDRLPVTLRYHGGVPEVPGVTVTHASDGTAQGYLSATSAASFGAALARQVTADHPSGSYGTRGLFANGLSISLPGAPAAPARHQFPMHTLTATGTNLAGKPDTGDIVDVFNVDDLAAFGGDFGSGENVFFHGSAKFSAPAGNYWGIGTFLQISPTFFSVRLDVLPQFKISGDTSIHFSAKAASSRLVTSTPRKAVSQGLSFTLVRSAPKSTFGFGWGIFGGGAIMVSPTHRKPSDGTLNTYSSAQLTSPSGVHPGYAYTLNFAGPDGLVPPLHYTARPADLTTVSERYFQDVPATAGWITMGGTAHQIETSFIGGAILPLHVPATQTQYISASPAMLWQTEYIAINNVRAGQTSGGQTSAFRLMHGGQHLSEDWNAYPLHPAPNVSLPGTGIFANEPSAVRAGDNLTLDITPFSDNQFGHLGTGFSVDFPGKHMEVTGTYELDQNGKKIAGGNAVGKGFSQPLVVQAKLSPKPATIRFAVNGSRLDKRYPLSATSQDVWTWQTRRQPSATVHGPWECGFSQGHFVRKCAVQPMLTLSYQVAKLRLSGTASPGQQAVDFTASHLQQAAASRITKAGAQVSFDNGKTWRAAKVERTAGGTFRALFTAPAHAAVSLRMTAQDASGATVTETLLAAYQTSAAPTAATAAAVRPAAATPAMRPACPAPKPGYAQCLTLFRPQTAVNRAIAAGVRGAASTPKGWSPQALRSAYKLPSQASSTQTVAVSIAFDTPKLAQYLATYRKFYGLPPCTAASGCFRKVNEQGKPSPLPPAEVGSGWDLEATLDVSMISAACPHCKILVVEGKDPGFGNLAATENAAAKLGASVISNSYGARESGETQAQAHAYDHPGHVITVSSGDLGFGAASFPANLATVTAVGGTQLAHSTNTRGWHEEVWNQPDIFGAGASGCSAYVAKPAWQHDPHCPGRTVADVAAVATNIPIFNADWGGWVSVAGTSASAPLIAGVYGLAGNASQLSPGDLYQHRSKLFDIVTGNNALFGSPGATCGNDDLCTAKKGYDAPTGLGTPDGTGAF